MVAHITLWHQRNTVQCSGLCLM